MGRTGDIAHLVIVEDRLAALVTCHVADTVVIAGGLAAERKADTRVVRLAHFIVWCWKLWFAYKVRIFMTHHCN